MDNPPIERCGSQKMAGLQARVITRAINRKRVEKLAIQFEMKIE